MYINNPCHMTKMAAMPIFGKTLQISQEPVDYAAFFNCTPVGWVSDSVMVPTYSF